MADDMERGSVRLIKDRFANRTLRERDHLWIADIIDATGVELLDFWVRGQPQPDAAGGTFRVDANALAHVVTEFATRRNPAYQLSIYPGFPRGAPAGGSNGSIVGFKTPCPDAWGKGQPAADVIESSESAGKR